MLIGIVAAIAVVLSALIAGLFSVKLDRRNRTDSAAEFLTKGSQLVVENLMAEILRLNREIVQLKIIVKEQAEIIKKTTAQVDQLVATTVHNHGGVLTKEQSKEVLNDNG